MTSYPPSSSDGDNDPTRSTSAAGGSSGAYGSPGDSGQSAAPGQGSAQPGYGQGAYPQGQYPQGGYPQGSYQQPGYQQGAYQGGYPAGTPQAGQPSYYSQPGYPGSYPTARGGGPDGQPPNFFSALFDFGFTRFATPSVIKVLYILIIVVVVLYWLFLTIAGFVSGEPLYGVAAFIGGGVVSLLAITFYRVVLEFFYAVVRMSEDIHNRR